MTINDMMFQTFLFDRSYHFQENDKYYKANTIDPPLILSLAQGQGVGSMSCRSGAGWGQWHVRTELLACIDAYFALGSLRRLHRVPGGL